MKYIIPNSINKKQIEIKKTKSKYKSNTIYKIYYHYQTIELIGIPYLVPLKDYDQYEEKIVIKNDDIIEKITELNTHILSLFSDCYPLIYKNTIFHSRKLKTKRSNLYLFVSSINTYKNAKKAKIYFIYD